MARSIDDPIADLKKRARRDPRTARTVHAWWHDHELDRMPVASCRRIAATLVEDSPALGIAMLELLCDQLRVADLPLLARLTERRPIVRLLSSMLARDNGRAQLAHAIGDWREGPQRDLACLALASIAHDGDAAFAGFTALALSVCATVVWSHQPADQAAVGALLKRLARAAPPRVEAFVRRYARLMSRPCVRAATANLPARDELLALHRRATSI